MSRPTVLLLLAASLLATDAFGQSPFETKPKPADKPAPADSAAPATASYSENPELKAQLEKIRAMSREERQAWLKEHPEAAEKIKQASRIDTPRSATTRLAISRRRDGLTTFL